jgi:chaperonin cofactor prefoldin
LKQETKKLNNLQVQFEAFIKQRKKLEKDTHDRNHGNVILQNDKQTIVILVQKVIKELSGIP